MKDNNKVWLRVPKFITIPSYIEYVENYEQYRFPQDECGDMLNNYKAYAEYVETINKSVEDFWKTEHVFNEDKTEFLLGEYEV